MNSIRIESPGVIQKEFMQVPCEYSLVNSGRNSWRIAERIPKKNLMVFLVNSNENILKERRNSCNKSEFLKKKYLQNFKDNCRGVPNKLPVEKNCILAPRGEEMPKRTFLSLFVVLETVPVYQFWDTSLMPNRMFLCTLAQYCREIRNYTVLHSSS